MRTGRSLWRPLCPEDDAKLAAMAGKRTRAGIAALLETSLWRVMKRCRELNLPTVRNLGCRALTDSDKGEIVRLAGKIPMASIVARLGVPTDRVYNYAREANLPMLRKPWTRADIGHLRLRYEIDGPLPVANALERTKNSVIGKANRLGLRCRKRIPWSGLIGTATPYLGATPHTSKPSPRPLQG